MDREPGDTKNDRLYPELSDYFQRVGGNLNHTQQRVAKYAFREASGMLLNAGIPETTIQSYGPISPDDSKVLSRSKSNVWFEKLRGLYEEIFPRSVLAYASMQKDPRLYMREFSVKSNSILFKNNYHELPDFVRHLAVFLSWNDPGQFLSDYIDTAQRLGADPRDQEFARRLLVKLSKSQVKDS